MGSIVPQLVFSSFLFIYLIIYLFIYSSLYLSICFFIYLCSFFLTFAFSIRKKRLKTQVGKELDNIFGTSKQPYNQGKKYIRIKKNPEWEGEFWKFCFQGTWKNFAVSSGTLAICGNGIEICFLQAVSNYIEDAIKLFDRFAPSGSFLFIKRECRLKFTWTT